ncbi:MAG: N-acetyltransferase [Bacteroidetes bacterium]|nr:N-acetyltransferase [Bacteroidota bacterium]
MATQSNIQLDTIRVENYKDVQTIYQQGIDTRNATFETSVPDWQKWNDSHLSTCRLTAYINHKMVGWAALSKVSDRCVYQGVAEVSIYIHQDYRGKGIADILMHHLIIESENSGIWSLMAAIFPENISSKNLHLKHGFQEIGIREKIAKLDGIWRDTLLMQRRSKLIGID